MRCSVPNELPIGICFFFDDRCFVTIFLLFFFQMFLFTIFFTYFSLLTFSVRFFAFLLAHSRCHRRFNDRSHFSYFSTNYLRVVNERTACDRDRKMDNKNQKNKKLKMNQSFYRTYTKKTYKLPVLCYDYRFLNFRVRKDLLDFYEHLISFPGPALRHFGPQCTALKGEIEFAFSFG